MRWSGLIKVLATLVMLFFLFACTQEPAVVENRGEVIYSFDSDKWHRLAQNESPSNFNDDANLAEGEVKEVEMKPLVKEVLEEQGMYKAEPKPIKDSRLPSISEDTFDWPVQGDVISKFGTDNKGVKHDGININVPEGTEVKAAKGGTVVYSGNELKGYGNLVIIKHDKGWLSAYGHLAKIDVKKGVKVTTGQVIGLVGKSGNVEFSQLHFALRKAGKNPVDPLLHLPKVEN
jgi:murein DD-endopeptidase MepM/ murein hydrolase activator NlpD